MAKAIGISLGSVQRIWRAHKLQPHRLRTFKRSRDPSFVAKLIDIVGLYVDPPAHAVVLSVDEKSQIQALDRTQPGLPIKPGRCQTMTHDYKRHGTTTLFAALSVLDGTVIGRCMQRHRHLPDLGLLAQRRRELLLQNDPAAHPPRRLPLDRRPAGRRHQCLSRRAQMPAPNPSSGPNPPRPFWPNSTAALYPPFASVH
jgi:hypothetical protein